MEAIYQPGKNYICLYLDITMESKKVGYKTSCKFTAALCTIAKRWKQPKCSLVDEWINKM